MKSIILAFSSCITCITVFWSNRIVAEDAVMFVETSAKFSQKSVLIAFEVSLII